MDRNADGKVSEEEYRNAMAFVFAADDTNHDGVITRAEATAAGRRALRKFEAIDIDKAGKVELPAFLEFSLSIFHAADADGDGYMTREERKVMHDKVKAARDAAVNGAAKQ
jgi:Ca2+-binding EF-hand superfamily protein